MEDTDLIEETTTITLPLKNILTRPELMETINEAVKHTSSIMKTLSELMNVILLKASPEAYKDIKKKFIRTIVDAISVAPRDGEIALNDVVNYPPLKDTPSMILTEARNTVLERYKEALESDPTLQDFRLPYRISNPIIHAINLYFTNLKNHATVLLKKRVQKYFFSGKT